MKGHPRNVVVAGAVFVILAVLDGFLTTSDETTLGMGTGGVLMVLLGGILWLRRRQAETDA